MYFVVGGNGGLSARFQLSFKYRLFDSDSLPVAWLPQLGNLYFGYTQNSLWDLGANSAPFRDTSYRPASSGKVQVVARGDARRAACRLRT